MNIINKILPTELPKIPFRHLLTAISPVVILTATIATPMILAASYFKPKEKAPTNTLSLTQAETQVNAIIQVLQFIKRRQIKNQNLTAKELECLMIVWKYLTEHLKPNLHALQVSCETSKRTDRKFHIEWLIQLADELTYRCALEFINKKNKKLIQH